MGTDEDWQAWGERDPYYGVLTHEQFRRARLTPESLEAFFRSGREELDQVLAACRRHLGEFSTQRSLDFGCGVGRTLLPLAAISQQCVGVDISEAMRAQAAANCLKAGHANVRLVKGLAELGPAAGGFSFIHSYIVLQHLDPVRALTIIRELLARLDPGGCAALHVLFARARHQESFGTQPPLRHCARALARPLEQLARRLRGREPEMQMNLCDMNRLLFIAHQQGIRGAGLEFTDHAGNLGAIVFLRRESLAPGSGAAG